MFGRVAGLLKHRNGMMIPPPNSLRAKILERPSASDRRKARARPFGTPNWKARPGRAIFGWKTVGFEPAKMGV